MIEIDITDEDLDGLAFDFGDRKEEFYRENIGDISNRDAAVFLGYFAKGRNPTQAFKIKRDGRLRVSRFVLLCKRRNKDSRKIISKYRPKVFPINDYSKEIVGPVKSAVYEKVCGGL
jgi:hypothetical protein